MSSPKLLSLPEIIIILNNLQELPSLHHKLELLNKMTNLLICNCIQEANPGKEEIVEQIYEIVGIGYCAALAELQATELDDLKMYEAVTTDLLDNIRKLKQSGHGSAFSEAEKLIREFEEKNR